MTIEANKEALENIEKAEAKGEDVLDPETTLKAEAEAEGEKKTGEEAEKKGEETNPLTALLEELELDSPEDLKDLLSDYNDLKGTVSDVNIDELAAKAAELEELRARETLEKQLAREAEEEPDETIARLKSEKKEMERQFNAKQAKTAEQVEAQKAIKAYDNEIIAALEADDSISPEIKTMAQKMFGSKNPANAIDIGDKRAVRKMMRQETVNLQKFAQDVITAYNEGKSVVPKVTESKATTTSQKETTKPKTIAEAGKIALERIRAAGLG
jgi:hypothetical protein